MVVRLIHVPCANCGRECRLTAEQSRQLGVVFCGGKCNREYVRRNGNAQKQIAMQMHADNLGIAVENLIL